MTRNVGTLDRTLGLVPLLTGFVRFCPAYGIVGINTCSRNSN